MRVHALAVAALLCGCASAPERPGAGPAPATIRGARYVAPADTQYFGFWQLQTLYYVHGRDTLKLPGQNFRVVTQQWSDAPDGLHIAQAQTCVGTTHCQLTTAYTLSPKGRILAVDGHPVSTTGSGRRIVPVFPDDRDL